MGNLQTFCVAKGHRVEVIVLCNPIVLQGFVHFTVPRDIEVHFASLKLATFSISVVKEVHLQISGLKVATFSAQVS